MKVSTNVWVAFLVMGLVTPVSVIAQDQTAVVVTAAADYSSGAHSVVSADPVGGPRTAQNNLVPTGSDLTVASYGDYFYRIERSNANNITKFAIDAPDTVIWQYSTEGNDINSNPHDLVFASAEKAYLLRYGTTTAWIVDPTAEDEADFKTGEIDLSAYADGDGNPEMHSGIIVEGYLYITLQRIDSTGGWGNYVYNTAYAAVIDTTNDQEVDTGQGAGGLLGIPLPVLNPGTIQYVADNDTVYVQGVGEYTVASPGGIGTIDPTTCATALILAGDATYGAISGMMIVSPTKGYFVGYAGWGDNTLYTFDPSATAPSGTAVSGLSNINIAGMESGVYVDKNNMLWVCNQTDGTVDILNVTDDTVDESVDTELNPQKVVFVGGEQGQADDDDDDDDDDNVLGCFIDTCGWGFNRFFK
jgi:hypothetical protein